MEDGRGEGTWHSRLAQKGHGADYFAFSDCHLKEAHHHIIEDIKAALKGGPGGQ